MPLFTTGKALDKNWTTPGGGLVWRFLLLKGIWVPDVTAVVVDDLVPATNELAGGNYSRQAIANRSITFALGLSEQRCDNPSWANLTAADVQYLVAFLDTGSDATAQLHSYYDMAQQTVAAATFNPQIQGGVLFTGS